ncbi:MAG: electron transfer flavoprotein subunit alpha/FixB family protein [Alphaproteobacteria bacterium]|nr:electron transfer flavoprotein subunit alpha/FixB family protein [Alphaproteobacteria bacterium]
MILVYVDHDRGVLDELSLQAVSAAVALGQPVEAVLVGADAVTAAPRLGEFGVTTAHIAVDPRLADYAPQAAGRAVAELATSLSSAAVLAVGSPRGNEVLAHVGAILDLPFAADCTAISLGSGSFDVTRNRWAGNVIEEAVVHAPTLIASTSPHAFTAEPVTGSAPATVQEFTPALTDADVAVRIVERTGGGGGGGVGLAEAKVVVSGGRGVGEGGFGPLEELAELLGGAVGCSRVVTSAGWRPHAEQVGQTGTKVAPDLYIACGISGATQHIAGCKNAKTMIAINTDPEATIMSYADYAIVGDVSTVLPAIVDAVRAAKS